MAEQNFKNHARTDVAFHLVIVPVLLGNLIYTIVRAAHRFNGWHAWSVVVAFALLMLAFVARQYALKNQDRIIRLEERIRMAALLPMESQMVARELSVKQVVALRFASDAELAALAERAVRERLTPKGIKEQIASWRADTERV